MAERKISIRPRVRGAGFTAIEVSAVVTIIAILALILIPIVRTRVEESKKVAAQDDMAGIEKAEEMAYGYTNHYYRLQDLNDPELTDNEIETYKTALAAGQTTSQAFQDIIRKIPRAYWDYPLVQASETSYLVDNWKGPYYAIHKTAKVNDLIFNFGNGILFHGDIGLGGPIFFLGLDDRTRLYPIDPWGNPYFFFGSGAMKLGYGSVQPANENAPRNDGTGTTGPTDYPTAAVYSLGPDGLPGTNVTNGADPRFYFREYNVLGTGDDLKREF